MAEHSFGRWALSVIIGLFLLLQGGLRPAYAHITGPQAAVVGPDGSRVYVTNGAIPGVQVVDTATNQLIATIPMDHAYDQLLSVVVSPDGTRLYITDIQKLFVIDTAARKVMAMVAVGDFPLGLAVSPDGKQVYVANYRSDTVSVVDAAVLQEVDTIAVGNAPSDVAVTADGRRIYVSNTAYDPSRLPDKYSSASDISDDTVSVIETAARRVVATVPVGMMPDQMAVTPDGKRLYVTHDFVYANDVDVVDTTSGRVIATLKRKPGDQSFPYSMVVSPDGKRLYVSDPGNGTVWVVDTAVNQIVDTLKVAHDPASLALSPDGKRLYVPDIETKTLWVIETTPLRVVTTVDLGVTP